MLLNRVAVFITDKLTWLVIFAGVIGFILAGFASSLSGFTPFLLALMMVGSGLTLPLPELLAWRGTIRLMLLTLLVQLTVLPLLSYALYQLLPSSVFMIGLLALGVAPSEITSALMTMLGGGELALATRLMAFSIFLSTFLTPIWLGLFLGQVVPIDFSGIVVELGLIITAPFLIASSLRTRFPVIKNWSTEAGGLSASAVVLLIFVVGGSIASFKLDASVVWLVTGCVIFNLVGYSIGWLLGQVAQQKIERRIALVFTSGMREFGIATAVALNFLPSGSALAPALYGLIMMTSATFLTAYLKAIAQNYQ